jgi:hypothetical protein
MGHSGSKNALVPGEREFRQCIRPRFFLTSYRGDLDGARTSLGKDH